MFKLANYFHFSDPKDVMMSDKEGSDKDNYEYFWRTKEFSLLNLEGQLHGDLRGLVAKAFLNRQVQELRPFMEKIKGAFKYIKKMDLIY
ncbi:MAG: hypothetical protein CM15mP96_2670 [Gammaproteobacteria bacterium]|nr:MAG: hypothetical protein CM15mP96_2670 [Gammaproteobacteria bacterium]